MKFRKYALKLFNPSNMKNIFFVIFFASVSYSQEGKKQFEKAIQDATRESLSNLYILNSDIGDITFGDQGHPENRQYILNANLIPHYLLTNKKSPVFVIITPIVKVRIFANQPSKPVRTPSFMPGATMFFDVGKANLQRPKYISVGAFHHSNGQDNTPLDPDGNINVRDGNFATNFLLADFHFGKHEEWLNYHYRLGLEAHSGLFKFGDEPAYRDKFGKLRLNYQFSRATYVKTALFNDKSDFADQNPDAITDQEFFRFVVEGMVVLDNIRVPANQRLNIELKAYFKPAWSENTALFVSAGYMGHDNYNIYFSQPYPFVRVGIAASNAFKFNKTTNKVLVR